MACAVDMVFRFHKATAIIFLIGGIDNATFVMGRQQPSPNAISRWDLPPLPSMKIPRLGVQLPEHMTQVHEPLCNQMPYIALALPHAVDSQ